METLGHDLRIAIRQLLKSPGFAIVSILTLAIGIGATTAIFSLADAVLIRPLQFANQDRLVEIFEDSSAVGFPKNTPAPGNYSAWKERNHTFADMAAARNGNFNLSLDTPERVDGTRVTANLFPILGVQPALGRGFTPEEDQPGGPKVAIISAAMWQQTFGGDPSILSRDVVVNYERYRIVGVMPRGFTFPLKSQLWIPLAFSAADLQNRQSHYLHVYGLLRDGVSLSVANNDLKSVALQLAQETPDSNLNVGAWARSIREEFVGDLGLILKLLLAGVGCVLLIACGNVAALMMARAAARNREIAVRAALGASRARLIQQALVESILLALSGSALGLALTAGVLPFLSRLVPIAMAAWTKPVLDWRVASFAMLISIGSSLLFGLLGFAPVKLNLLAALQQGGRGIQMSRHGLRRVLVTAQIALALPLIVASCLMVQTVWKLSHVDMGFDADHVMTARTPLVIASGSPYADAAARARFYRAVVERLESVPGVIAAGYTSHLPLTQAGDTNSFIVEGEPPKKPGEYNDANVRLVTPHYFEAMKMRIQAGRGLQESDSATAAGVVVLNQTMARKYFHTDYPIGRRLRFSDDDPAAPPSWYTVVGVIEDVRQVAIDKEPRPEMYFSYQQTKDVADFFSPREIAVRVTGDPNRYAGSIRKAVWSVDPQQPVSLVQPMQALLDEGLAARDIQLKLFAAFGLISLLLSAIGLYGLLAFTVRQQKRDTGVRMALGAQTSDILRLYLSEGARIVLAGLLIGAAGSAAAQQLMKSVLFGVSDKGVTALGVGAIVLLLVGLAAVFIPAQEAAGTQPMEALRTE